MLSISATYIMYIQKAAPILCISRSENNMKRAGVWGHRVADDSGKHFIMDVLPGKCWVFYYVFMMNNICNLSHDILFLRLASFQIVSDNKRSQHDYWDSSAWRYLPHFLKLSATKLQEKKELIWKELWDLVNVFCLNFPLMTTKDWKR